MFGSVVLAAFGVAGPFGEAVGEIEAEHPGRTACVHLPRLGLPAVHCLNLKLTAKRLHFLPWGIGTIPEKNNSCSF